MTNRNDEWGNIELPGFDDSKLLRPDVNKVLANISKNKSKEMRRKVVEGNTGQKRTEESKLKMSIVQKQVCQGKIPTHLFNPITRQKAADSQRGIARPQTSAKLKGRPSALKGKERPELAAKLKGKAKSEEHKANMRKPKIKSECPHCKMMVAPNIMSRYHGDNCKFKGENK